MGFNLDGVKTDAATSVKLVLTINDDNDPGNWGPTGRTVDAHALLEAFAEGDGKGMNVPGPDQTRGSGDGVTWKCGIDTAIENQQTDCTTPWNGGWPDSR